MSEVINPFHNRHVVFIPQKLDLDKLLFDNPIQVSALKHPDQIKNRMAWILGQIYSARASQKNSAINTYGYGRVCSSILVSHIRNYKEYINYLLECNVLESGEYHSNYEHNPKCTEYRISDKYYGCQGSKSKWKPFYIYETKFYQRIKENISKIYRPTIDGYGYLIKHFEYLDYDDNLAADIIESYDSNKAKKIYLDHCCLEKVRHTKEWYFNMHKYGRFYNPITNMSKELRTALRCSGEPLVEIDIKSSIPYFSLSLFNNTFLESNNYTDRLLKECNRGVFGRKKEYKDGVSNRVYISNDSYLYYNYCILSYMLCKKGNRDFIPPYKLDLWDTFDDVKDYKRIILEDDIYVYMADYWNKVLNMSLSRKEAKDKLLSMFNSPSTYNDSFRETFRKRFPTVLNIVEFLNTGYYKTNNGRGKNKKTKSDLSCPFAKYTQALESWFVHDLVCKKLDNEYPECKYYTIHDALYTTNSYKDVIQQVLSEESTRLFGYEISNTSSPLILN